MRFRPAPIISSFVAAISLGLAVPAVAAAAPVQDLEAQAKVLEEQLAVNGAKIAALGEQLNAAQISLDEAQASIADADARIEVARAEAARLKGLVRDRAAAIYRKGGAAGGLDIFDASSASEANSREQYGEVASRQDNELLDELAAARADLAVQKSEAQDARESAQAQRDTLAAAKAEADAAAAAQQALLDQVQGEIGELVRQEQARRAAAAAAATPKGGKGWSGPVPDPAGGAGAAVSFAQAQLGKPYEYAATGPDTYDCSGLTMRAWQAGGVSMPHYSGAQGSMFPRVPLDQLQPGDLITTSSWSAHVGIWVGGGYIHATHTGDVIRYVGGSGSVVDAVRPG